MGPLAAVALALVAALAAQRAAPQEPPRAEGGGPRADAPEADLPPLPDDVAIEELWGPERAAAEAALHARLEEEYFLTSDRDGGGWISYREARASLRLARDDFWLYDADRDGRISREEFGGRYRTVVASTGGFRPPQPPPRPTVAEAGTPEAYDYNGSGALEVGEVERFLGDRGLGGATGAVLAQLDADGSGALEAAELAEVEALLASLPPPPDAAEAALPGVPVPELPSTLAELFGAFEERSVAFGTSPLPPRVRGPVPVFLRLDHDRDGRIEESDLLRLLAPARVAVRPGGVLAALDRDGDGALSRAELDAALGAR